MRKIAIGEQGSLWLQIRSVVEEAEVGRTIMEEYLQKGSRAQGTEICGEPLKPALSDKIHADDEQK